MIASYQDKCVANGHEPGVVNSSIFFHFADTAQQEQAARERQIRYFLENCLPSMKTSAKMLRNRRLAKHDVVEKPQGADSPPPPR